jgi:tagatose 1,6-diphosphate aldolase
MPIYATKGVKALEDWLSTEGVKNINAVNAALKGATPWAKKLGIAA